MGVFSFSLGRLRLHPKTHAGSVKLTVLSDASHIGDQPIGVKLKDVRRLGHAMGFHELAEAGAVQPELFSS